MKGLTLTVATGGFPAKWIDKAEYGGRRGRNVLCCRGAGGMSGGGASCDGNGVVETSVFGGEEAYFWENIVCREGRCTVERR